MDIVVFESLYGCTAAVATAIAEGLGGAVVLTTSAATPDVIADARLVVAGAPVHAMGLPTAATRASALAKSQREGRPRVDLGHATMRAWLATVPDGPRLGAAFDTRMRGPLGTGAAEAIGRALTARGIRLLDAPRGFMVDLRPGGNEPAAVLAPGQLDAARAWGAALATSAAEPATV